MTLVFIMLASIFFGTPARPHPRALTAGNGLLLQTSAAAVQIDTGTHWASPADFPTLKNLGYQFVITTVGTDQSTWRPTFDAAQSSGLQLIVGLYPPPFSLRNGAWSINADGTAFLRYAASRAALVKAVFVYNEPYWVNPLTNANDPCGALPADQLRGLRTAILAVWPDARIYHDIGQPSAWAPGGSQTRDYPCVGTKYADASGVADYAGIWSYPFDNGGYHKADALNSLRQEITYVQTKMQALPILLGQSFQCLRCGEATRWPSAAELQDWNCATRALAPAGISWYVWRQGIYDDYLAKHPEMWSTTSPSACAPASNQPPLQVDSLKVTSVTNGSSFIASRPIAPGTIVSLFGRGMASDSLTAPYSPLPKMLGSTMVIVNGSAVPLFFVSPAQINCQFPFDLKGNVANVIVQTGNTQAAPISVSLLPASPSIFTQLTNGAGPGTILRSDRTPATRGNPVQAGETISLYATGLGAVSPPVDAGTLPGPAQPSLVTAPVQALVDGVAAAVTFAGLTPNYAGVYEVDVRLPAALGSRYPNVVLVVNGVSSSAVSAGGPGLLDVTPSTVAPGAAAAMVLRGANLSPATVLQINGQRLAGQFSSSGGLDQLRVVAPAQLLQSPGRLSLTLINPESDADYRSNSIDLNIAAQ